MKKLTKEQKQNKALIKFLRNYWKKNDKQKLNIEKRIYKENVYMYEWIKRTKEWNKEMQKELIKELEKDL